MFTRLARAIDIMPKRQSIIAMVLFGLVMLLYIVAVFSTFNLRSSSPNYGELIAFVVAFIGGSVVFGLGYTSVIIFGGKASLRLVEFISRLNGSKHTIEITEETKTTSRGLTSDTPILYFPVLVFMISLALALNIHYLHTTTDITVPSFLSFQYTLSILDILLKPASIGSLRYSVEIIPIIIFIVAIAGIVPSLVLPYLRKFRVTSVNAAPFHRDILFSIVGIVFGLTVLLSLVNIIFGALTGNQPHYYNFVLPTMLGFSLHYSLGAYIGQEKAEEMVEKILKTGSGKRVFLGKVSIHELLSNKEQK